MNKNSAKQRFLLGLILILSIPSLLSAQNNGKIIGSVYDAETGEALIGVNVFIVGTTKGSATDIDGNFNIENVSLGTYTIKATYVSYADKLIEEVLVTGNEATKLTLQLSPESLGLEEVTVIAEVVKNSDAGLLSIQRKALGMQDGISAQMIAHSGSGDAADAMKKIVGASVIGGKYINIRGLGDRYSSTLLNGVELPTADPDKKSFQLDLFPTGLLDNIVTIKTFTPDKPGNFSGGLVNVETKDIPSSFFLTISSKQGYNSLSNLTEVIGGSTNSSEWLGFDNGKRALPSFVKNLKTEDFPNYTAARQDPTKAAQLDHIAKSFSSEMIPFATNGKLNQSYSISYGDRFASSGITYGYSASLSYANSYSAYTNGVSGRYELIGNYEDTSGLTDLYRLSDQKGSRNIDWGGLINLAAIINVNNKITFTYLRTQSGENQGRYLSGYWIDQAEATYESRVNQYTERNLSSYQLKGKHSFNQLNNSQIEWKLNYAENGQEQPDLRYFASQYRTTNFNNVIDTVYSNPSSLYPRPSRFYRNLSENNFSGSGDIIIPISISSNNANLKFGGIIQANGRVFEETRYDIYEGTGFRYSNFDGDIESYFKNFGVIGTDKNGKAQVGLYVIEASSLKNSYDAEQSVNAGYAMIDADVFDNLKIVTGVRLESTEIKTVSRDTLFAIGQISSVDILPSLNVILNLTKNMNLRAAATQTLARPTFRELAPYISFDFVGDFLFEGNANLNRTLIQNYDLRWEWYPNSGELFAVSGFFKYMENPIERVLDRTRGSNVETVQNVRFANVFGLEIETRKQLDFLSDYLKNVQVSTNLSLVTSEVKVSDIELDVIRLSNPTASNKRQLAGQSPFLFNFDLNYFNPTLDYDATLSYNTFGDRLSKVTIGAAPDVFERSHASLNFTTNKKIGKHIQLSFSAENLLNPTIKFSQNFKSTEYIYQSFRRGVTYAFGVKYLF